MTTDTHQFGLTEEQQAIYDAARDFANEQLAPHALEWDRDHTFPDDVVRKSAALGIGGIYIDEQYGGAGLTRMDATLIFEALSTGCPAVASYITIHNMVAWMISRFGSEDQRRKWLPSLCEMTDLGSYCLTEPGSGSDAAALSTRAERDGDYYVLTGVKQFISGAGATGIYVVMARTGGPGARGISAFVVPGETPGLSFGPNEDKMGWKAQPTRQVILENVRIPVENRLDEEGTGFKIAMAGLDGGRLNIAACSVGGAQSALEKALAYVKDREAFGNKLVELQAPQFKLADMATQLEVSRTFLRQAASALDAKDPSASQRCAMAKQFVTDACFTVANEALQLHGGYGYLSEYGVEKLVRDLRAHQIVEGANEIMRVIVFRNLMRQAA